MTGTIQRIKNRHYPEEEPTGPWIKIFVLYRKMSSVVLQIAQRLTNTFVVTSSAAYSFSTDAVEFFSNANATSLGNSYIIPVASFGTGTLPAAGATLTANATLKDLGKEVRFGTPDEASLVVYRKVQRAGLASTNGRSLDSSDTFYVCVENNTDLTGNKVKVGVARV